MKIIALQAENIKKLVAIEIKPDGNMVQITGKNGAGKTSVLDSIWWALAGTSTIQKTPIRQGETRALIKLDLGEIIVTRKFKMAEDGEVTSSLSVENWEGARFPSPQSMLDELIGSLSFDPLAFARMDSKLKFNQLRAFVPNVDFDAIETANKADFQKRTDINRRMKEARTLAEKIIVSAAPGTEPVDETALINELEKAGTENTLIETRRANREKVATEAATKRNSITYEGVRIAEKRAEIHKILESIAEHEKTIQTLEKEATDMEVRLDAAEALPEPVDTAKIKAKLEAAKATNAVVEQLKQRSFHVETAKKLEAEAAAITKEIENREAAKNAHIASAKLPVPGIGFGEEFITLNGVPFEQASDAEQLRASISIAMALNPKLRVIRVRDGSLLDESSVEILAEMAKDQDFQVWIEKVDSTGKIGFVIENGLLKQEVKS